MLYEVITDLGLHPALAEKGQRAPETALGVVILRQTMLILAHRLQRVRDPDAVILRFCQRERALVMFQRRRELIQVIFRRAQIEQRVKRRFLVRITSYNVCYTKLLRKSASPASPRIWA